MNPVSVTTVVVSHNRKKLLRRCLHALSLQSLKSDHILVVDNASTDGTHEIIEEYHRLDSSRFKYLVLDQNTGGAGGFATGLKHAIENGAEWVWMMDDDAEPHPDALHELTRLSSDPDSIYGSVAACSEQTSWPLYGTDGSLHSRVADLPDEFAVVSLPFLGFMVSARTVERIGYPDADYFIAGDDHEYCLRAKEQGIGIIACGRSLIEHPSSSYYKFGVGRFGPTCFYIQPWKRYYDVRNRLISARRYEGTASAWIRTFPATLIRWLATMIHEPNRVAQSKAYVAGIWDGLLARKGKRHPCWGLG